jgi:hypothetical protein
VSWSTIQRLWPKNPYIGADIFREYPEKHVSKPKQTGASLPEASTRRPRTMTWRSISNTGRGCMARFEIGIFAPDWAVSTCHECAVSETVAVLLAGE